MYQRRTVTSYNSYKEENPFHPQHSTVGKTGVSISHELLSVRPALGNRALPIWLAVRIWMIYVQLLQMGRGTPIFRMVSLDGLHYIYLGALHIISFCFRNIYRIVALHSSLGDLSVCIYIFYYNMLAFTFRSCKYLSSITVLFSENFLAACSDLVSVDARLDQSNLHRGENTYKLTIFVLYEQLKGFCRLRPCEFHHRFTSWHFLNNSRQQCCRSRRYVTSC